MYFHCQVHVLFRLLCLLKALITSFSLILSNALAISMKNKRWISIRLISFVFVLRRKLILLSFGFGGSLAVHRLFLYFILFPLENRYCYTSFSIFRHFSAYYIEMFYYFFFRFFLAYLINSFGIVSWSFLLFRLLIIINKLSFSIKLASCICFLLIICGISFYFLLIGSRWNR